MAADPKRIDAGRPDPGAAGARLAGLYEAHGRMVYGVCRLLLRDPHEAEDAAQQTFLSAHGSLLAGTEPREPGAWLATIARNECRARVEKRMREPLAFADDMAAVTEGPEHAAARRAELAALVLALRELPDAQREAVVLRDVYGLRYEEVSAAMGVSGAAVESLLFRARKALQTRLAPVRFAAGGLAVPAGVTAALAEAVPGFVAGGGVAAIGAGAGAGAGAGLSALVAKLVATPVAAKVAAATLAVGAAGTAVGLMETKGPTPTIQRAAPAAVEIQPDVSDPHAPGSVETFAAVVEGPDDSVDAAPKGVEEVEETERLKRPKPAETSDDGADRPAPPPPASPPPAAAPVADDDATVASGDDDPDRPSESEAPGDDVTEEGAEEADDDDRSEPSESSGPGSGDDEEAFDAEPDEDHSGSDSSGSSGSGEPDDDEGPASTESDDDSSGPGSGEEEPEADSSGPGSGEPDDD